LKIQVCILEGYNKVEHHHKIRKFIVLKF